MKTLRRIRSIILVVLNTLLVKETICWSSTEKLPEIQVSKWVKFDGNFEQEWDDFPNNREFLHIEEDLLTVSQHLLAVSIICNASYPVQWTLHQSQFADLDLYDIELRTTRTFADINNPTTYEYTAVLNIAGEFNKATGNYTCTSTRDSRLSKSIFVFWEGSSPPFLVLSGKTVSVKSEDNHSLILPCFVSQPDVKVSLFVETKEGFVQLEGEDLPEFDARIGFTVNLTSESNPNVKYKCTAEDDDDFVTVNVEPGIATKKVFVDIVSPGASLHYDEEKEEMICCSNSDKPPSLRNIFCSSPSACKMHESKLFKIGSNGKKIVTGNCVSDPMFIWDSGITRCKGDGIDTFKYFYTDFSQANQQNLHLYFDWESIKPENMMRLMAHTENPVYTNQNLMVTCETLSSYFSYGVLFGIRWTNGSTTYFPDKENEDDIFYHEFKNVHVTLTDTMAGIVCMAPVWNSSQWINSTLELDVQKSLVPQIIGTTEVEVIFALNDTEKFIECKSFAVPSPTVYWLKNNKSIPEDMVILKENGTLVVIFHRVSHETQGDYTCHANNFAGSSQKIVHVYVQERISSWGTVAEIVIPILVLLFLSITAFLVWKVQIQKKVMNHLTQIAFRDVDRNTEYATST